MLLAISIVSCRPASEKPAEAIERIILISIDTLRADALGAYGNPLDTSPYIDAIAKHGTLFRNCIAPSPMTFPSHATMLTGLHPLQHGVLVNMQAALPQGIQTLPERLRDRGWRTGAVVSSSVLHHRFDLDRGFDDYRDDFYSALFDTADPSLQRTNARTTTREAIEWLKKGTPGQREFLFVHYIDPHSPYNPPSRLAANFPDSPYLGEVAFVDRQIARLVHFVNQNSKGANTLWIITSDHGEALGEHGESTHGFFLYDEVLRVPLIFAGPGVPRGQIVNEPVGLIDIVPTVLSLVGAESDSSLPGLAIPTAQRDRSFVSISYISALGFGWSPLWSLSKRDERFILGPNPEYYRTDSDPEEAENRRTREAARAAELEKKLRKQGALYLADAYTAQSMALDSNSIDQLAALGYTEASSASATLPLDDFSGRDPVEMYKVVEWMSEFANRLRQGDYTGAEAALDSAQSLDPGNPGIEAKRGKLFIKMGRAEEFIDWIGKKSKTFQNEPAQRHLWAQALAILGRTEEAETLLKKNIAEDPGNLASLYELAGIQMKNAQPAKATASYARVIDLDPVNISALINYANLLTKNGQPEPAATHLETVISLEPENPTAHRNLGIVYAKLARFEKAIAHLERSRELRPSDPGDTASQMIEALRQTQRVLPSTD